MEQLLALIILGDLLFVFLLATYKVGRFIGFFGEDELAEFASDMWMLVKWLAMVIAWLTIKTGRGLYLAGLFVFLAIDEWRRGLGQQDEPEEEARPDEDSFEKQGLPGHDPYEHALLRFDLSPGFTQADLKQAYQKAMKWAHPDAGGSDAEAKAVNAARDVVARRMGWK